MIVAICEDNLLWSVRLANGVRALGHDVKVVDSTPTQIPGCDVAIVNLGARRFSPAELIPQLRELGAHVIGHAGHKEKELLEAGETDGCDSIVTNGMLAHKLADILNNIR